MNKYFTTTKSKVIALIVGLAIICAIGVFSYLGIQNRPVDPDSEQVVTINIQDGYGTYDVAKELYDQGLIKNITAFRITSKLSGFDGKYLTGYYQLSPSMSAKQMMKAIVNGDVVNIAFTVIPGDSTEQIATKLEEQGICTYDEFMDEIVNGDFDYEWMKYLPKGEKRFEGFLYPETYSYPIGVKAHTIVETMLDEFDNNIDSSYYAKAKKMGRTFYEVIIISSIVEKEAGLEKEKPLVSSVIYNRLKKGMMLQMDSTVSYLLKDNRVNLTNQDIAIDSPYNTYKYDGLPPTPIGNSGASAIKAAFNPEKTDYLFFVLSEKLDGSSNFSKTLEQFNKDKDRYYKAYDEHNK
ncbi:MAG: endolytic transglycosylase MltG [Clostridia bacterium]|nr:endolytic transglycosylase MltG [Clostridia bacterium]